MSQRLARHVAGVLPELALLKNSKGEHMRYLVLGWSFFAVTITLIVWTARPDMIESAAAKITSPYREYKERRTQEIWHEAKEQERSQWMLRIPLPRACSTRRTAVEVLECKNFESEREKKFERIWQMNIAKGWRPAGIED